MHDESSSLPWDELQQKKGGIPWPALRAFAEALATDRELTCRLLEVYDRAYETASAESGYTDFYVAGIFALAAPTLDDERRREIGSLLIDRLTRAGRDDAGVSLEILTAAVGTMGPVILPTVLDTIAKEPDTMGTWVFLWSLTTLVVKANDQKLRDDVARACVDLLEKADRREIGPMDADQAVVTLAILKRTEYTRLIQRLADKFQVPFAPNEYAYALKLLQGRESYDPSFELWEQSVEEWLTPRCRTAGQQPVRADEDEEEAIEEADPDAERVEILSLAFVTSPMTVGLPHELRERAPYVVRRLVHLSLRNLGKDVTEWDESTMRKLLVDVLPRHVPAERELLLKIVPITEAFLYWLGLRGMLTDADAIARSIHGLGDEIVAAGMKREEWGPAKSYVMEAVEASLDPEDPEVRHAIVERHIDELVESLPAPVQPPREEPPRREELPIPIVEHAPKIARNAPCPCGSGRKYKKCHGRSETAASAD
jgi:hypothetical protein